MRLFREDTGVQNVWRRVGLIQRLQERTHSMHRYGIHSTVKMRLTKFQWDSAHMRFVKNWRKNLIYKHNNNLFWWKGCRMTALLIYAGNEPKSVLARDLGDCRDNLRNSRSVFLIVGKSIREEYYAIWQKEESIPFSSNPLSVIVL